MKTTKLILIILLALPLWLGSCMKDMEDLGFEEGLDVSILIATGVVDAPTDTRDASTRAEYAAAYTDTGMDTGIGMGADTNNYEPITRAPGDATGIDSDIRHFRVLIFNSRTGTLVHKDAFEPPATPQQINMTTGLYDFVFIANDNRDATITAQLDALVKGSSNIRALRDMTFASNTFGNDSDDYIPMLSVVRGVRVLPEGEISLPGRAGQDSRRVRGTARRRSGMWRWNASPCASISP